MDEQKEKIGGSPAENPETPNPEQELHDEMETLAKVFQTELDRAKAEANAVAQDGVPDPEITLDAVPPVTESTAPAEPVPEEMLCECCGEQKRGTKQDPNSPFCASCDHGLRHYPFDFLSIFFAVAAICFVFYGAYVFADHLPVFVAAQKADSYRAGNKLYSALDAYTEAANTMLNSHINGELIYKREIEVAYALGYVTGLSEPASNIRPFELSLPHFRSLKWILDDTEAFLTTWDRAGALVRPYLQKDAAEIPYDTVIAQLDALITEPVVPTTASAETATENAYTPQVQAYSAAAVGFYKYQLALICNKDLETQIAVAEEIRDAAPDYVWLYAPLLGEMYAKTGRDIAPICAQLEAFNAEDSAPELFRVIALRISGDYAAALEKCTAQIEANSDLTDELYRQAALVHLAQGNFADAYTQANLAYQSQTPSVQTLYTVALCALAAGHTDAFTEVKTLLEDNGYTLSEEVVGYQNGTVTLEEILLEGDYDLT